MTNVINTTDSNYKVPVKGIKQQELQETLQKSKQAVSTNISENSAVQAIGGSSDPKTRNATIALVPVLYAADSFVNKQIAKTNGKGLLDKVARLGDKISKTFNLDGLISKKTKNKISSLFKGNRFTQYFSKDFKANPVIEIFTNSETMVEKYTKQLTSELAKVQAEFGINATLAGKANTLKESTKQLLSQIASAGTDAAEPSVTALLDAADDLVKNGINGVGKKASKSVISQASNSLKASTLQTGKTGLGRLFAKGALKGKDVITYGGGLLSLYFMASALVNAIKATKEAPKGEKKSTFMHVMSEQYLGIILFQPSINLAYKLAGNKYRGMTKEGRQALANLVNNANKNLNLTKDGVKIANIQKQLLLKGVDHKKVAELTGKTVKEAKSIAKTLGKQGAKIKFWEHPLKFLGRILGTGLDTIGEPMKIFGKPLKILGKKIKKPTFKGFVGGLGRLLLIMMVIQPLIQKPLTKLCHKIFGKPTTYLKKQEEQNKAEETKGNETNPLTQQNRNGETNLINIITAGQQENTKQTNAQTTIKENTPAQTKTANYSDLKTQNEIPALNLFKKEEKKTERYIPSIHVEPIQEDTSHIDKIADALIRRTDAVVINAEKLLG